MSELTYEVSLIKRSSSLDLHIYERKNKTEKVCDEFLIEKFERLFISQPKDENLENKLFKDSVVKSLNFNTQSRYFQSDLFSFCYICREVGHIQRLCTNQEQEFCLYCLDTSHHSGYCKQVCCYKCHLKGHRKQECKFSQKNFHYQPLLTQKFSFELIQCLNCNKFGHINCNQKY